MDENKAHNIVAALASGVDPITGKPFPADSPYQSPDIVRALYIAAQALEGKAQVRSLKGEQPANAGKPWSEEEDRRLITQFDGGQSLPELARAHGRTVAGIQARLERHGRLEQQANSPQRRPQLPQSRNGAPTAPRGRGSSTP